MFFVGVVPITALYHLALIIISFRKTKITILGVDDEFAAWHELHAITIQFPVFFYRAPALAHLILRDDGGHKVFHVRTLSFEVHYDVTQSIFIFKGLSLREYGLHAIPCKGMLPRLFLPPLLYHHILTHLGQMTEQLGIPLLVAPPVAFQDSRLWGETFLGWVVVIGTQHLNTGIGRLA